MARKPRMRMFAGPNGGGKSTLIREIEEKAVKLGVLINADHIYSYLNNKPFLDLEDYLLREVAQKELKEFARDFPGIEKRLNKPFEKFSLEIKDGFIVCKNGKPGITSH